MTCAERENWIRVEANATPFERLMRARALEAQARVALATGRAHIAGILERSAAAEREIATLIESALARSPDEPDEVCAA